LFSNLRAVPKKYIEAYTVREAHQKLSGAIFQDGEEYSSGFWENLE
jgi:hypothetical protein